MGDVVEMAPSAPKKERSPSFPYIGLTKAQDRLREFYTRAKRFDVRVADAASAWGWAAKSSAVLQTISALLAYGLIEDQGSGENRKIKISERGFRILEDQRPGMKERELSAAAQTPKLIAEYIEHWKTGRPDDSICISELKIDRGFTEDGAKLFLRVFDDVAGFTTAGASDKKTDEQTVEDGNKATLPPAPTVKIGDYVQWTSNGIDQFKPARKVVGFFPDGVHAQVFGSNTGVPMAELTVVDPPAPASPFGAGSLHQPAPVTSGAQVQGKNEYNVLQTGRRLQITADVDLEGLQELKEMLGDYEKILTRLSKKQPQ